MVLRGIHSEINLEDAISYYEKTIKLNPRNYLAYRGPGNYYLKNKDYLKAEDYYTKVIAINPCRFGPIYKNRAFARYFWCKGDLLKYLEETPNAVDKNNIEDAISQLRFPDNILVLKTWGRTEEAG